MQKRRYADTQFGQIHYRKAGLGPPLILLHQSPRSSREYEPLIDELAKDFTVFAPDTPGNGMSDPLTVKAPTMLDYGDAIIAFMDSVGLSSTKLYGYHTGASICTGMAKRYPERISKAVANGLCILNEDEKKDFLNNYCPDITPKLDGSHLSWLWRRIQAQADYFPWYRNNIENKLDIPPYTAEKCQAIFEDFIIAGNNYITPYLAAFEFNPIRHNLLPANNLTIVAARTDPLIVYMNKLPENQEKYIFDTHKQAVNFAFKHLKTL